jgi:uncharacterized protein YceK
MKNIFLIISLLLLMGGCSLHQPTTKTEAVNKAKYSGDRAEAKLLGVRIACGEKRTEWGYTEEVCGNDWGRELIIDWGTE